MFFKTGTQQYFQTSIFFFLIYLSLAALGLRFCARAFSSCGERGPLFITVRRPLTIAASLAAEHGLQTRRLSNCGSRAQLLRGMSDLPGPELKPASPALAGRLSTTAPPGKPPDQYFYVPLVCCPSPSRTKDYFPPLAPEDTVTASMNRVWQRNTA